MAYRRRRAPARRSYARPSRSRRAPMARSYRSRGRYRGRARSTGQTVRLVIQTPSDMLPPRPAPGQFARLKRRARF